MNVRKTASTSSAVVDKLFPGERAKLLSAKPGWYRVELGNGKRGYVSKTWTDVVTAEPTPVPHPTPAPTPAPGAWFAPSVAPGSREMNVHVIDVGQGAATLFEFPCGAALIDTGGEDTHELDGTVNLFAYLDAFFAHRPDLGGRVDLLLLTHPHQDHTKGACEVIARYQPRNLVDDGLNKPTASGYAGHKCLQNTVAHDTPYHQRRGDNDADRCHLRGHWGTASRAEARRTERTISQLASRLDDVDNQSGGVRHRLGRDGCDPRRRSR